MQTDIDTGLLTHPQPMACRPARLRAQREIEAIEAIVDERRRQHRTRSVRKPRRNTICPHPEGDVLLLEESEQEVCYVPTPVRRDTPLRYERRRRFMRAVAAAQRHRQDEDGRIRRGRLDDLVTVELLLHERGLQARESHALWRGLEAHPDTQWISTYPADAAGWLHRVRFAAWGVAARIVDSCESLKVLGLDMRAPDDLFRWLAPATARARLSYPTIDIAVSIGRGRRITLAECRDMDVWLEPHWDGRAYANHVTTDGGENRFEVLGGHLRSNRHDWLCDFHSVADAADLAALLNVSATDVLAELAAEQRGR